MTKEGQATDWHISARPLVQEPHLTEELIYSNTEIRSGPLCTESAPPLHPRSRQSWCEEQEVRQSGSLYAWCTYQVVIEQGVANGLLLATCGPPFLA
jgi:hypothetical protein